MTGTAQSATGGRKRATARWRQAGPLIVVLVAAAVLAAACGGASHDAASSSVDGTRESGILFTSCMRSHGVSNFPDPVPGGGFDVPRGIKTQPQFSPAFRTCRRDLPGGVTSPKRVNIREQLSFASCVRSHGITGFPDPLPGGGFDITFNTNSPQFEAAARVCQATGIHWNAP
jgi:hypothetical protein